MIKVAVVRIVLRILAIWGALSPHSESTKNKALVGRTVTVITDGAEFISDGEVIGEPNVGDSFRVDDVKGNLLFIKSRNAFLDRRNVVPYGDAIEYFTRKIKSNPNADDYDRRGRCWKERGALNLAIEDFNKAIQLQPEDPSSYVNRGLAWKEKYDLDKAIADFTEALRIRPGDPPAVTDRGIAWGLKGNHTKALADFDEAIRIEPDNPSCYNNRGWVYRRMGNLDAAMKDFDECLRLDPHFGLGHKNRADVWIRRHEYDKAIDEVNKGLRLNSSDARFFTTRANARLGKGLIDDALADFEQAIKMDPTKGHDSLAWLRATSPDPKLRNGKQAVEEATKACELSDWKSDSCLQALSAALAEQGKFSEAIAQLQKAIDTNPDYDRDVKDNMMSAFKAGKPYRNAEYRPLP